MTSYGKSYHTIPPHCTACHPTARRDNTSLPHKMSRPFAENKQPEHVPSTAAATAQVTAGTRKPPFATAVNKSTKVTMRLWVEDTSSAPKSVQMKGNAAPKQPLIKMPKQPKKDVVLPDTPAVHKFSTEMDDNADARLIGHILYKNRETISTLSPGDVLLIAKRYLEKLGAMPLVPNEDAHSIGDWEPTLSPVFRSRYLNIMTCTSVFKALAVRASVNGCMRQLNGDEYWILQKYIDEQLQKFAASGMANPLTPSSGDSSKFKEIMANIAKIEDMDELFEARRKNMNIGSTITVHENHVVNLAINNKLYMLRKGTVPKYPALKCSAEELKMTLYFDCFYQSFRECAMVDMQDTGYHHIIYAQGFGLCGHRYEVIDGKFGIWFWSIDFRMKEGGNGDGTLVVGENISGKSMTVNPERAMASSFKKIAAWAYRNISNCNKRIHH